jgi:hypothetical protein
LSSNACNCGTSELAASSSELAIVLLAPPQTLQRTFATPQLLRFCHALAET